MTTLSKDEYLKQSRALATGFGPTADFADPQLGRTVQHEDGIPTAASDLPGQVYSVDQLPNPAAAIAYGLPPVLVPEHLILDSDNTAHIQGKTADDIANADLRRSLGDPMLTFDNTVRSQDDSLAAFSAATGAGLGDNSLSDKVGEPFVDGVKGGDGNTTSSTAGATGPVDPEGVQKGNAGQTKAASEKAGTQGQSNQQ